MWNKNIGQKNKKEIGIYTNAGIVIYILQIMMIHVHWAKRPKDNINIKYLRYSL